MTSEPVLETTGLEALWEDMCGRWGQPLDQKRRDLRTARSQWIGQDNADSVVPRLASPHGGLYLAAG